MLRYRADYFVLLGPGYGEFKVDFESIFERMSRARNGTVSSIVVDHGNPGNWHGSNDDVPSCEHRRRCRYRRRHLAHQIAREHYLQRLHTKTTLSIDGPAM